MYLVTNKNNRTEPELYPSFIVEGFIAKAKKNNKNLSSTNDNSLEFKTKKIWLRIEPATGLAVASQNSDR